MIRSQTLPLIRHLSIPGIVPLDLLRAGELTHLRSLDLIGIDLHKVYEGSLAGELPAVELSNLRELGIPVSAPTPHHCVIPVFRHVVDVAPKLTSVILRGTINSYVLGQVALLARLECLQLADHAYFPAQLAGPWDPIELRHLWKLHISGIQPFVLAMFHTITTTAVTHLHLNVRLDDASILMAGVMLYPSLTHLHLDIKGPGDDYVWTGPRILGKLKPIPNLVSFRFFVSGHVSHTERVNLTNTEAEYICQTWPNLLVVGVGLADHTFFLGILNLPHLQELELNAWRWAEGWVDTCHQLHPALCFLGFSGCPSGWCRHGPIELNLARFPNLQGPHIVPGHGGLGTSIPKWARSNTSSEFESTDDDDNAGGDDE